MMSFKYKPLAKKEDEDKYDYITRWNEKVPLERARKAVYALSLLLAITIVSNGILLIKLCRTQARLDAQSYVGLERNVPLPIPHDNRTIDDPIWDSPNFDVYTGWVALSEDWVEKKKLVHSMRWPWDPSKSVYVFHAYHSLHCVYVIRQSLMEFRDGKEQMWEFEHVTHCLHTLREDTTCNADDTPRYGGTLNAQAGLSHVSSGVGQLRMCRDWSQLRRFSLEHSACYQRPLDHYVPLLDRYKYCPDGSKPWEMKE